MRRIKIVFIILCLSIASTIIFSEFNDHIRRDAYHRAESKITQNMMERSYRRKAALSQKYLPNGKINKDFKDIPELNSEEIKAEDAKIRNDEKERIKGVTELNDFLIGCTLILSAFLFLYLLYLLIKENPFPRLAGDAPLPDL